jgi:phospholipid transport system substrate-binding protein
VTDRKIPSARAWIALLGLLLASSVCLAAEEASPTAVVESLHNALISSMKSSDEVGYQARYDKLDPVIESTFDLEFMAEKSVGRHWKDLGPEDRKRWSEAFERMTTANYAGRFVGYTGQHFETLGQEPAAHDTVVVRSKLIDPGGDDVQLNYRLRETPAGWRIVDVYLNGTVSELALRRSEYSSVLQRDGFETLLAELDEKAHELATAEAQSKN